MSRFGKILIANRGEIACRIMRTAVALGYRTVAVFSDADAEALHVRQADMALRIGPAPARESYLNSEALLDAARRTGVEAVHPGYGFLSENAAFAAACAEAGIVFVGPPPAAIAAMGNKARAKVLMHAAGVPCVPGYQGEDQSDERMTAEASRIGFPLLVKAAAGGGGRGMRLLTAAHDLANALARARSEAARAFGSGELILERAVAGARHVEFQIFADQHGNVIHLGERDCSIQRRHQKVIEEAPSPFVSSELRARMGEAAVAAARAIDYVGAGTVEFLLDPAGQFYFLEMNTRLQVEHAVTEAVTGLDLVAWQLDVAAGAKLPLAQPQVVLSGHAVEARIYAEDPENGFLPQSGTIIDWRPARGEGVRVDHGLLPGSTVSPFYDPMLAKVIGWGATREEARRRLTMALEDTVVFGIKTNRSLLLDIVRHPAFTAGEATTAFVERYFPTGGEVGRTESARLRALALSAVLFVEASARSASANAERPRGWSSTGVAVSPLQVQFGDTRHAVNVAAVGSNDYSVALASNKIEIAIIHRGDGIVRFAISGVQQSARFALKDDALFLDIEGEVFEIRNATLVPAGSSRGAGSSRLVAPMNGVIVSVLAKPDDAVAKGQCVVVLEAMKMQHEIVAERGGIIDNVFVKPGDQVATRALLAELRPDEPAAAWQQEAAS